MERSQKVHNRDKMMYPICRPNVILSKIILGDVQSPLQNGQSNSPLPKCPVKNLISTLEIKTQNRLVNTCNLKGNRFLLLPGTSFVEIQNSKGPENHRRQLIFKKMVGLSLSRKVVITNFQLLKAQTGNKNYLTVYSKALEKTGKNSNMNQH